MFKLSGFFLFFSVLIILPYLMHICLPLPCLLCLIILFSCYTFSLVYISYYWITVVSGDVPELDGWSCPDYHGIGWLQSRGELIITLIICTRQNPDPGLASASDFLCGVVTPFPCLNLSLCWFAFLPPGNVLVSLFKSGIRLHPS